MNFEYIELLNSYILNMNLFLLVFKIYENDNSISIRPFAIFEIMKKLSCCLLNNMRIESNLGRL